MQCFFPTLYQVLLFDFSSFGEKLFFCLRGYRHGGAAVSDKHCGFVVNLGGATCADVLALCDEVRAIVKEKTGYDLEKEIRVVR